MVLEVGIDLPGQMAVYARMVRPDVVVVTSVGSEHNRSLGTLETTRFEKSAMVARLPPLGLAVLNGDDANVLWMRQRTGARAVTFGFGPTCDVRATDVRLEWPRGTRFMLHVGGMKRPVALRLLGRQMVGAALAAIAVALEQGAPVDTVLERLSALAPTSGRLQPVALEDGAYLLRDEFKSGERRSTPRSISWQKSQPGESSLFSETSQLRAGVRGRSIGRSANASRQSSRMPSSWERGSSGTFRVPSWAVSRGRRRRCGPERGTCNLARECKASV